MKKLVVSKINLSPIESTASMGAFNEKWQLILITTQTLLGLLFFVFPLITMADRTDDVAQLSVKAATTEFVDQIRTTGRVTQSNYDKYVQQITSTGNTYDVEMEIQVKDENLSTSLK